MCNNLAGLYNNRDECKRAKELYEKSLKILRDTQRDEGPEIASMYNNLAEVYMKQKGYEKAEKLYKKKFEAIKRFKWKVLFG